MPTKKSIILITDGDTIAVRAIERVANRIGGRSISRSGGNPTPLEGPKIQRLIWEAASDLVLVLFDDNGHTGVGPGERALQYIATCKDFQVLGALAVASNSYSSVAARVHVSVTKFGQIIPYGVDKHGEPLKQKLPFIYGDTVGVLNELNLPVVVGIGDIGKMRGRDIIDRDSPITYRAVLEILRRSGYLKKTKTATSKDNNP
ncbi:stage V sporulation protein AE [Fodinisporobacter ferrooxydans]|uniref:Stage V sporulation protein AE n=1 Tax=Fodinisporobacter ferrooxydans TaxID=2901836 RepID=A0ABY4CRL5_9BACL|nr:stage V sporulation protein AE [Alicyclobacillaceae bacterium MYW30-H2]